MAKKKQIDKDEEQANTKVLTNILSKVGGSLSNTVIAYVLKSISEGVKSSITKFKTVKEEHETEVKRLEDSGPIGKVVAKYKYGNNNIEDQKRTARNEHLLKAFVKMGFESAINDIKEEPGDWIINKLDKIDRFKGISNLSDKKNIVDTAGAAVVNTVKLAEAYEREIPIGTAVEGLTFYSLDEWYNFYKDVRNAREEELGQTLDYVKPGRLNQYKIFDELMANELKRYFELLEAAENYSDNKVLQFWKPEGALELVVGRTSPYLNMIKYHDKNRTINTEGDIKKQEILDREIRSFPSFGLKDTFVYAYDRTSRRKKMTSQDIRHDLPGFSSATDPINIEIQLSQIKEKVKDSLGNTELSNISIQTSDLFVKTFEEPSAKAIAEIDKMMEKCKILNDFIKSSSEEKETNRKNIAEQLGITEEALKKLEETPSKVQKLEKSASSIKKPLSELFNSLKEGYGKIKEGGLSNVGEGITQISGAINSMMPSLNKFATDMGVIFGENTATDIQNTLNVISATAETAGGVGKIMVGDFTGIFDVASGISKIMSKSAEAEKRHQEALKALSESRNKIQHEYNLLLMEQNLLMKEATSIFGEKKIAKAANAILEYGKAIDTYKETLRGNGRETSNGFFGKGFSKIIRTIQSLSLSPEEIEKQSARAALLNARVVTGHKKTGLFGWGSGKDTYSNILTVYPDLIDNENKLNIERAKSILNNQKMEDGTKDLIKNLIDYQEQAEKAEAQLREYLKETFGGLGDALSDSIVTAFAKGEDAASQFKNNVTSLLNDFAKQIVYELYLAKLFENLQKDMEVIYKKKANNQITEKELSNQVTDLLGGFFNGLDGTISSANSFLEGFWRNAESNGFDQPNGQRQGTTGQGISSMTQDSANELNGNFYALRQQVGDIRNFSNESLLVQRTMQSQLARVAENTEYCRYLENVKNSLEDIQTRGVKIKV